MSRDPSDFVLPAADFRSDVEAFAFLDQVPALTRVKVGMELQDAQGADVVTDFVHGGYDVFNDRKIHDIPKTMGADALVHAARKPEMLNCMSDAGVEGMGLVADACRQHGVLSVAVTVLTSKSVEECIQQYGRTPREQVLQVFAPWALEAGIDILLCSPDETEAIRSDPRYDGMKIINPGIRPIWTVADGQTRFTTPTVAIQRGADYLVVGSPLTDPKYGTPAENFERLCNEIAEAA